MHQPARTQQTDHPQADPYLQPNGVMRNKLGIDDRAELEAAECVMSNAARARFLGDGLPDVTRTSAREALQNIHRALLGDLHAWAGTLRTITMRKKGQQIGFLNHSEIDGGLRQLDDYLRRINYLRDLDDATFTETFSRTWATVNFIHPFREGNGRTTRLYLDSLAAQTGRTASWDQIDKWTNIDVSIASSPAGDNNIEPMTESLTRILHTANPHAPTSPVTRPMSDDDARSIIAATNASNALEFIDPHPPTDHSCFTYLTGRTTAPQLWTEIREHWIAEHGSITPAHDAVIQNRIHEAA